MNTTMWISKDLTLLRDVYCGDKIQKSFFIRQAMIEYIRNHISESPNKEEVAKIIQDIGGKS